MCAVFSAGESGRTGEVSRIVEAGRSTEEKTPRPGERGGLLLVDVGVWIADVFVCLLAGGEPFWSQTFLYAWESTTTELMVWLMWMRECFTFCCCIFNIQMWASLKGNDVCFSLPGVAASGFGHIVYVIVRGHC